MLIYKSVNINDKAWSTFDVLFTYDLPSNNAEVIGNLRALREMGALSMESMLELSPMTSDVGQQMECLNSEGNNKGQVQRELEVNS